MLVCYQLTDVCYYHMLLCMRTTLNIEDNLMRKVKKTAAESGRTITELVEEALRSKLAGTRPESRPFEFRWITVAGKIQPGVDLADRDALTELMEDRK